MEHFDPTVISIGPAAIAFLIAGTWLFRVQRNIAGAYQDRNVELEARLEKLETDREKDRTAARRRYRFVVRAVRRCENREVTLLRALAAAGVAVEPAPGGAYLEDFPDGDEDEASDIFDPLEPPERKAARQ